MVKLDDVTIARPAPPATYLGVAESMVRGVKLMAERDGAGLALPLAAAHTLECALKAFLSREGQDTRLKHPSLRHNLVDLWTLAKSEGLPLDNTPHWVTRLSEIHDKPYYLRYSTGIHGIVTPAPEPMATELCTLIETVRQRIHDYRNGLE